MSAHNHSAPNPSLLNGAPQGPRAWQSKSATPSSQGSLSEVRSSQGQARPPQPRPGPKPRGQPASTNNPSSTPTPTPSRVTNDPGAVNHLKYVDIGCNLGDPVFRGRYHGKQAHPDDFQDVLARARGAGVEMQVLTGDNLKGSREVIDICKDPRNGPGLYCTVGCHPTRTQDFDRYRGGPDAYLQELSDLIARNKGGKGGSGKVVAVGECGLDWDRLFLSPREAQLKHFEPQLRLASQHNLPLFLHSRACASDFNPILRRNLSNLPAKGVVHSFTSTDERELDELVEMGFYIGLNGCSMKTPEQVDKIVKRVPLDKLMLETDAPWCSIRPSSPAHPLLSSLPPTLHSLYKPREVKKERYQPGLLINGRNEPCTTGQVAWAISQIKEVPIEEVVRHAWNNTVELFGIGEKLTPRWWEEAERKRRDGEEEDNRKKIEDLDQWPSLGS